MCNSDPVFIKVVQDALREYSKIANSHAVDQKRKDDMLSKVRQIEALIKGSARFSRGYYDQNIKPKINELLDDLMSLSPVSARPGFTKIVNTGDVRPRQGYQVLVRTGNLYSLKGSQAQSPVVRADGSYVFTVLMSAPWEVRIGERIHGGHTAISRGADVYFAGEITFQNGNLVEWNNSSGHYIPDAKFSIQIGNILPIAKFKKGVF